MKKEQNYIIGVDIGGTKIAAGLVNKFTGELLSSVQHATPKEGNDSILACMGDLIDDLIQQAKDSICGIGIGIPGVVDRFKGIAVTACNLNFKNMPIAQYIWDRFKMQACLENDTNAGALGEKWFGKGKGYKHIVYIALGTGIGGGLILDGKLYLGRGEAGEIGHMIIDPQREACSCGAPGCIESLASGTAIARQALSLLKDGSPGLLQEVLKKGKPITAKEVFSAAASGDSIAEMIVKDVGRYLAYCLISLINLFDPEIIIIGGGVSASGHQIKEAILSAAPTRHIASKIERILHFSQWTTGIIGAAAVVLERYTISEQQ